MPVANAQPEDIQDLLGGALFKALYKWMLESGPVYLLPTGACVQGLARALTVWQTRWCLVGWWNRRPGGQGRLRLQGGCVAAVRPRPHLPRGGRMAAAAGWREAGRAC